MALLALRSQIESPVTAATRALWGRADVAEAPTDASLLRILRERPIRLAIVDGSVVDPGGGVPVLDTLTARFPRTPVLIACHARPEPRLLLAVGRCSNVRLASPQEVEDPVLFRRIVDRTGAPGPRRLPGMLRYVIPRWELSVLARAVHGIHLRWSAECFAKVVGLSRPALSARLRGVGLPSPGSLLTWIRVFYAAWWLPEPGRSGASVAAQLEYSSGAALRRTLRNVLGVTPTDLVARGGLDWAWLEFLRSHPGLVGTQAAPQPAVAGMEVWRTA